MAEMRRRMASLEEALARAEEAAQPKTAERPSPAQSSKPVARAAAKAKAQPRKSVKAGAFAAKLAASRGKSNKKGGR
jgi:hypothetical protein